MSIHGRPPCRSDPSRVHEIGATPGDVSAFGRDVVGATRVVAQLEATRLGSLVEKPDGHHQGQEIHRGLHGDAFGGGEGVRAAGDLVCTTVHTTRVA